MPNTEKAERIAREWFETPCEGDPGCNAKYHDWDHVHPEDKAEILKTVTFILERA